MDQAEHIADYVLKFVNQTYRSIFLTGKAGTGKTTLLRKIIETTHKNAVIVAPTGIAALNAGGVTIHSFFQLPFATFIPNNDFIPDEATENQMRIENFNTLRRHFKMPGSKKRLIESLELLIIDEVSMLRADVLDAMNFMLQHVRRNPFPFGGVQVLFIGDLLQLPPVVKNAEWQILRQFYDSAFFFSAKVIEQNPPLYIELEKIFRQTDDQFIGILNNLRNNKFTAQDSAILDEHIDLDFDVKNNDGYIILTTHNEKADRINEETLKAIASKTYTFKAEIIADFPEKIYPVERELHLKEGAQVIFVKNDPSFEKRFFNGKMGIVSYLDKHEIRVFFPDENVTIEVEKYEWQNIRYKTNPNTKEIEEEILGTFTHYPIKLAWAITVHKSQGLTFDKAALDISEVFAPGQAYVALSRLRSLGGLKLISPLKNKKLSTSFEVSNYAKHKIKSDQISTVYEKAAIEYLEWMILDAFSWKNLQAEWQHHLTSYQLEVKKSKKLQYRTWAETQTKTINEMIVHSERFLQQVRYLFHTVDFDFEHIKERCEKAYAYFFPNMDHISYELLLTIERVKRTKNVKALFEELTELEHVQINTAIKMQKLLLALKCFEEQKPLEKQNLLSQDILNYRLQHLLRISDIIRSENLAWEEEDEMEMVYYEEPKKKKKEKKDKKPTTEVTLEMFQAGKSIDEIAVERKLSANTILSHIQKLIEAGSLNIHDVLPQDKLNDLASTFEEFAMLTNSEIKEIVGNKFTWEEIRMYRSAMKTNSL